MLSLRYRPASLADLDAIYDFIATDNPARALKLALIALIVGFANIA
jgi:plasmid stabilization system protein ParE